MRFLTSKSADYFFSATKKHLPENQESVETPNVDRMINAWRIVKLYEPSSDRTLSISLSHSFQGFQILDITDFLFHQVSLNFIQKEMERHISYILSIS